MSHAPYGPTPPQWGPPQPPPQPPKPRFGLAARIGMLFGGLLLLGLIANLSGNDREPAATTQAAAPTYTRAAPPAPSTQVPAVVESTEPAGIGDGTWIIGADMQPGTYRSTGAKPGFFEFCSWSTRAGASTNSDVIDFGTANADEPMVVEISSPVKAFITNNCAPWVKVG